MQKMIFTFETDEEFEVLDAFFQSLEDVVEDELGCKVIRSKLETPDEIYFNGEWEDEA